VARQKEPFRKCCCCSDPCSYPCWERLIIPQLSRFFQLGWPQGRLGTPHLWGPEDRRPIKSYVPDSRISGCMHVAVGDTEPPPTLVQTLSLGRETVGRKHGCCFAGLASKAEAGPNSSTPDPFKREIFDNKILSCYP
jgi:hypothetical protein